jgi:hypothetical protein
MEDKLATYLEKMNFIDWVEQQLDTKRLIRVNLIAGIARGFGIALGGGFVLGVVSSIVVTVKHFFF